MAEIKFNADMSQVIAQADKAAGAVKKIGTQASGLGGEFIKINEHMAKGILRGVALLTVFKEAAKAANAFAAATADIAKSSGGANLARSQAINRLGLGDTPGVDASIRNARGPATDAERTQGMEAFASYAESSRFPLTKAVTLRFISLVTSGLYKADELIEMLKSRRALPSDDEVAARLKALTPEGAIELEVRAEENAQAIRKEDAASKSGPGYRKYNSEREARALEHPVATAVLDTGANLPVIGPSISALERETTMAVEKGDIGIPGSPFGIFMDWLRGVPSRRGYFDTSAHEPDRR